MSNGILYDPLLVHYLARELDQRLRGRACAAAPVFAAGRSTLLPLDRGEALSLDLHPHRGWIRLVPWESDPEELDAVCIGVEAPVDERLLRLRLHAGDRFRAQTRQLVVELATNQWNALLVSEEDRRVVSVLWERTAGGRALRSGAAYQEPPSRPRFGVGAVEEVEARSLWRLRIADAPPERRRAALLGGFAWTGSANAGALLGEAATTPEEGPAWEAFARWWRLRSLPAPEPVVLRADGRPIPYPLPLPGVEAEPAGSLLEAMGRVAEEIGAAPRTAAPSHLPAMRARVEAAARRVERLEAQLSRGGEAERMRLWGDLLLARKRLVPRGAESVRLQDWSGKLVEVTLDPTLSATENADRWYEEARKRERADARLPELLEEARAEHERWRAALEAAEGGEVPEWVAARLGEPAPPRSAQGGHEPTLPYRRYRTSGGLEVRVGRNSRDNDQLTFGHSSPNDVWLHARSVPGSHVILRWSATGGSPPARDLEEAAGLAALFSRARSSSLVPVDWTRRKYVRKPRGAPPGSVIPQQVKTVFVEPDPALEERLRVNAGGAPNAG